MDQPMLPARKVTNMEQVPRPYGVLGRVLGHSYTPTIYRELAGLDYRKFEREPEDLEAFVRSDEWEGFNVTIPYKRDLVPYMDELSAVSYTHLASRPAATVTSRAWPTSTRTCGPSS